MLADRTSLSGYVQNFLMGVVLATIACSFIYYILISTITIPYPLHLPAPRLAPRLLPSHKRRKPHRRRRRHLRHLLLRQPLLPHRRRRHPTHAALPPADVVRLGAHGHRHVAPQHARRGHEQGEVVRVPDYGGERDRDYLCGGVFPGVGADTGDEECAGVGVLYVFEEFRFGALHNLAFTLVELLSDCFFFLSLALGMGRHHRRCDSAKRAAEEPPRSLPRHLPPKHRLRLRRHPAHQEPPTTHQRPSPRRVRECAAGRVGGHGGDQRGGVRY